MCVQESGTHTCTGQPVAGNVHCSPHGRKCLLLPLWQEMFAAPPMARNVRKSPCGKICALITLWVYPPALSGIPMARAHGAILVAAAHGAILVAAADTSGEAVKQARPAPPPPTWRSRSKNCSTSA